MSLSGDQTSLPDSRTQFSSLRSRWHILREWRKATAESISDTVLAVGLMGIGVSGRMKKWKVGIVVHIKCTGRPLHQVNTDSTHYK